MAAAGRARRDSGQGGARDAPFQPHFVHIEGSKVAEAFRAAAVNGLRSFLEGLEEGLRKAGHEPPVKPGKPGKAGHEPPVKPGKPARPKAPARPPRKPRATGPSPAAPGAAGG
jgi:hypothetical protein